MNLREIYEYYSREDVREFIANFGKDREVAGVYRNGSFSQRPNVIVYPKDVTAMTKTGVVEFHGSLERWSNPMNIRSNNHDQLRTGWDLILDLDCKLFEHGKIAAESFMWGLKKHDVKGVSIKFTGGTGFHMGIPWESMPKTIDYRPAAELYPELARKVISYLKDYVFERFEKSLYKKYSEEDLAQQINKPLGKIVNEEGLNVYEIVDVDPIVVSPRHLFRLPYSLNAKSFLVSLPLDPKDLGDFERINARAKDVKVSEGFLDRWEENGAELLIAESVDWHLRTRKKAEERKRREFTLTKKITEDKFPPCVKNIMKGLSDGRKRSAFMLINFLRSSKWTWDEIDKFMTGWNLRNKPPLRENYIRSQVRWHRARNKSVLPPNCDHEGWYEDFGVCSPDSICGGEGKNVKNPFNYPLRILKRQKKPGTRAKASGKKKGQMK